MSLMASRGTLDLLTLNAVREMFTTGVEERSGELIYAKMGFQDNTPIKPDQTTKGVSGPGRGLLVVEGEDHKANQLYPSYEVTTVLNEYTSVLSYTRDDVHWLEMAMKSGDTLNNFGDIVEDAVNAVQENINDDAAAALYLGWGTTRINVGNSEALFSAHTIRKTGTTFQNTFTDFHYALTSTSLQKAISERMNRYPAHNNIPFRAVRNLTLIVGSEGHANALQTVISDYGPNNSNVGYQTMGPTLRAKQGFSIDVESIGSYLPSDRSNYWFLVEQNRAKRGALLEWAWRPEIASERRIENGAYIHDVTTKMGPKIVKYWAFFGSQGTGLAV